MTDALIEYNANGSLIRPDWQRLAEDFLRSLSERTREAYRADIEDFAGFIGVESINKASAKLVSGTHGEANALALSYKAHMREVGLAPSTINRRCAALRSLVRFANTIGLIPWRLELRNERSEKYRDTSGMKVSLFQQLLEAASSQENRLKALRDVAILRLFMDLGLRREEVTLLDFPLDLDQERGVIKILGKGENEKKQLGLPQATQLAIAEWLEVRGNLEGALFTSFDRSEDAGSRITNRGMTFLIRDLGKRIGIKLHPHKLRHTAITEACKVACEAGMPIEEVLDFSRHKDLRTLLIYRDREENVQLQLSEMIAKRTGG